MSFIKNIISKDFNLAKNALNELLSSSNGELFFELTKNSDFIFPFVKNRIIKDFVKLVNKKDLKTIFEFAKIYSSDFEDLIIQSWLKFAEEDLTDEILNLFETGTKEQKAYAAKYFSYIKDPLALDYLKKEAFSDFEPRIINCAKALRGFNEIDCFNKMKERAIKTSDEFEKISSLIFISAYNDETSPEFVIDNGYNCAFRVNAYSNLFEYNNFSSLNKRLDDNRIIKLFCVLIEGFPELLSLDNIEYYEICSFIDYISNIKTQYALNALLAAKLKFNEFCDNEIYLYDVNKETKVRIKEISSYLNSLNLKTDLELEEINCYNNDISRFNLAMDCIKELKLIEYKNPLSLLINEKKLLYGLCAKVSQVLFELNGMDLINKNVIDEIEDENIKAYIKSLMNTAF